MPRNGAGTMSVPNSFSNDTIADAVAVNANMTDIAAEVTNSLPRDGQAGMSGQFKAASGSVAAPGLSFGSDTGTGLFRKTAGTIGIAASGVEVGSFDAAGSRDINGTVIVGMPTGVMMPYLATTAPMGWVTASGKTIGNAASGATERANADTATLFAFLWGAFTNAVCPVSGGRGATAAADFAANKTITLPDLRGRGFFGLDNMGGTSATRLGNVITSPTTNGQSGGSETVALVIGELPAHTHTGTASGTTNANTENHTHVASGTTGAAGAHAHNYNSPVFTTQAQTPGAGNVWAGSFTTPTTTSAPDHTHSFSATTGVESATHSHVFSASFTTNNTGSNAAHSNMPPAWLGTYIIKL